MGGPAGSEEAAKRCTELNRTVGPTLNERIGNPHIRAHAAEGILFRRVLEVAATQHKLRWRRFSDRDFEEVAASELRRNPEEIKATLTMIGHSAGKRWRADERAAATAAWLMLQGT